MQNMVDTKKALVFYVCKQGWGVKDQKVTAMGFGEKPFTPFREFEVVRNDEFTDHLVEKATPLENWKRLAKVNLNTPAPSGVSGNTRANSSPP